jgi:hypothetical protein
VNTKNSLRDFAKIVSKRIAKTSKQPEIIDHLPKQHILPRTTGYVTGFLGLNTHLYLGQKNILGFDGKDVAGAFAMYQLDDAKTHLLLIRYPDLNEAKIRADSVYEVFSNKYESVKKFNHTVFLDSEGLQYCIFVVNNFLYIFSRSTSFELIQNIME